MHSFMRTALGGCAILALSCCESRSDQSTAPAANSTNRYVGNVLDSDDDTSIGVVVQGRDVAAYICPDHPAAESYPGWLVGELDGADDSSLRLERDGWLLEGSWSVTDASGTLASPEGAVSAWYAPPAQDNADLYGAYDEGCMTGVIVVSAAPLDVRGAWCNAAGLVRQVTPLQDPWTSDGDLEVRVDLASGARELVVSPVELPLHLP